ncbi:hypothetical protein J2S43_000160 [Catenuloplanes nepalensis]|uniref:SWIM-type domain-containing protein n=1 Tax=Catenuloplanes nepalensis TaxID=587533 RepID=A0ABT9MJP9_9ACTN|nr:hypothetical protein [Catenuloplanes nepalensis]MDP9791648.1 hypothetical protein [Catenuloplanes nepalensis]
MVVLIDFDSLHGSVAPEILDAAYPVAEDVDDLRPHSGGALGTVGQDSPAPQRAWAGFVDGTLTGRCECGTVTTGPENFCVHLVAVVVTALNEAFPWSPTATLPDTLDDPATFAPDTDSPAASASPAGAAARPPESPESTIRRLAGVAATLPPATLAHLLAQHAATDPRLEAALLTAAGLPTPHLLKNP